ncbi:MAG: hypothetical protein HQM03_18740 [Magnetococcales bacterium]|nr:hypothetical protein [Magnetococcales bacterium]
MRFKTRLLAHLQPLIRNGKISVKHDGLIEPGQAWKPVILAALQSCDAAIFLLSPDFVFSEFVNLVELPALLARKIRYLPVLLYDCQWQETPLRDMQIVHPAIGGLSVAKANAAWTEIAAIVGKWAEQPSQSVDDCDISRLPLPSTKLIGRRKELQTLDKYLADPAVAAVGIIALGGVGKSALCTAWLDALKVKGFGGARKVFGWSFYSQGQHETQTSSDPFFTSALPFFGHAGEMPKSADEKADLLARLLARQPSLLILDGVEPLQYPPSTLEGNFKDPGLLRLMRLLRTNGLGGKERNGLVLLSSRWEWPGLQAGGSVRMIPLGRLSNTDGVTLLKSLGVKKGLKSDFPKAVQEMDGHALALVLLGKLLFKEHGGDIARRNCLRDHLDDDHAHRVMAHYDQIWPENADERIFLQLLGLFDRPMTRQAFEALRKEADLAKPLKKIPQATLQAAGLLLPQSDDNQWDAHPLVREYFGMNLAQKQPDLFRQAHRVLFEFFANSAPYRPDTLQGLEPLYRAVHHGCQAGEYKKAMNNILQDRIFQGNEYFSTNKLGSVSTDLVALAEFFSHPWKNVVESEQLSESDLAWVLGEASFHLMALGRMTEAVVPRRADLEIREKLKTWRWAARSATNLVDLLIPTGGFQEAREVAARIAPWAKQEDAVFWQMIGHAYLAHSCHRFGELEKSVQEFQEAERLQKEREPEWPQLYGVQGVQYCNLLLDRARDQTTFGEVRDRGKKAQEWAFSTKRLLEIALDHMTQGRALAGLGRTDEAREHLDDAVTGIHMAGSIQYTPYILTHRAAFLREQKELAKARLDLEEALEICVWSGMVIYEAEARLVEVELLLDEGKRELAKKALDRAEKLILGTPYPLRQKELERVSKRWLSTA